MEIAELQAIASKNRVKREAIAAFLIGGVLLGLFFFIPLKPQAAAPAAISVATSTPDAYQSVALAAHAAIVYDLTTKQVLYAKNADAQLPLASLTKLLTVYTALATLGPDAVVTIPADAEEVDAPHAFNVGQEFTLQDLARLTLTGSLNDGAVALADAASTQAQMATPALLASAASGLDLAQTYALNGSGLDESAAVSGGYGSAHDVAVLAGALASTAPDIALATTGDSASGASLGGTHFTIKNTNPGVAHVPGLLLSKTGYTDLAGGNLALVFDVGLGHPVAVVVLGSTEDARFTDGNALVAATFAHFSAP